MGNQGEIAKCFLGTQGRIRKAKEELELKLLKEINGSRKGFYSHNSNKRNIGENAGLVPIVVGEPNEGEHGKGQLSERLNVFTPSAFTGKFCCSLPGLSGLCLVAKLEKTGVTHSTEGPN